MNNKKALIFGIDSFTGQYLKNELENNNIKVFGTSIHGNNNDIKCDITKIDNCYNAISFCYPDYIINLAAISFIPHSNYLEIYNVNFFGSLNILNVCKEKLPNSKLLLISSAQVYKNSSNSLKEISLLEPKNNYAISKKAMEDVVSISNYNCKVVRAFNYTGIGQNKKFIIPKIISHFQDKKASIRLGDIDVSRDFSDVRDIVRAYRYILLSESNNYLFNVCSSNCYSLKHIFSILCNITNHKIEIIQSEEFMRDKVTKKIVGNCDLLKSIGWNQKYNIEDTLNWMLNS